MIIVSYDFESNRIRGKFAKFLEKYGGRIQYSVFEIKNSKRVLKNILIEIQCNYEPFFTEADSILIYQIGDCCLKKIKRYGYAVHEESDFVCFS